MKLKYVNRPEKPATRFELMREVVKGQKVGKTFEPGAPSEYEPTRISAFLGSA